MASGNRYSVWLVRLTLVSVLTGGVTACEDCSLSVSTAALPDGVVGVRYFAELNSHCGGDTWFLQTGLLPPGIGLQDNGDLEGTPTTAGTYTFTVGVFDFGSRETAYKGLAIQVDPATATPTVTPTGAPTPSP